MTELVAQFQTLPVVLINVILEWVQSRTKDIWYIQVDETTGKLIYRQNVRLRAALISANWKSPLLLFTYDRLYYWEERSKPVTIYIDGEVIPAIEHCIKMSFDESHRRRDHDYPHLYVSYEHNKKMEHLVCYGTSIGNDPTHPETFYSCTLYRFDVFRGQYFAHQVNVDHLTDINDYSRVVSLSETQPIDYLHECRALAEQYLARRMTDRYAKASMILEMQEDLEIEKKMQTAMELMDRTYNPYLNIYEFMPYNYSLYNAL